MAAANPSASPLFLRESEVRRGMELIYFGHQQLIKSADSMLIEHDLGRAHHRVLYFVARQPDLTVTQLLSLLSITKQSLGRVLTELTDRGLIEMRSGDRDRRQRLLRLSETGRKLESEVFEQVRNQLADAYKMAGQNAVGGFWTVLEGLIPEGERARVIALRD
jgi:DNA-binding MarR family transcriptional regulator